MSLFKNSRFFKQKRITEKSVVLNHQRVFILPTRRGLGFIVLITILFLIAFVYNNNLSYFLSFLLASIFLISILHSYKSLYGLQLTWVKCHEVFSGETLGVDLLLSNPTEVNRINLEIGMPQTQIVNLQKHEQKKITLHCLTDGRGWHAMEKVTLSSTYPFGFFKVWSSVRFSEKYLVYPASTKNESLLPLFRSDVVQQDAGIENRFQKRGGDDFHGLKNYQGGDAIRHIDWKSFAKGLGLFTKQFEQENTNSKHVQLDFDLTTGRDVEDKLSQLCRWVIDAEKKGVDYSLLLPGFSLQPNHGKAHYKQCLEVLAMFNHT